MQRKVLLHSLALLSLTSCATTEPGWTGQGAIPFDEAQAACEGATLDIADEAARYAVMTECMAAKGWSRG